MSSMIYRRRRDRNHSMIFFYYFVSIDYSVFSLEYFRIDENLANDKKEKKMNERKFKYLDLHEKIKLTSFVKFH